MENMQKLTRAEEQLMLVLWRHDKAFLKDLLDAYPAPKPSQSTISTLLRTLERKGFVAHKAYSKVFEYYPLVTRKRYMNHYFKDFLGKYFNGSLDELVGFIAQEYEMELRPPTVEPVTNENGAEAAPSRKQLELW